MDDAHLRPAADLLKDTRAMKFSAVVVDFDGTIARNDVMDARVREEIARLRAQGIVVILATGRILDDLRRVAGDLHFVDAVVAENGAVVEFPESGYTDTTGPPPSTAFLEALGREGIRFAAGRVIIEADAADAARLLAIIRRLEAPVVLVFNRGRVMVLPESISKATGVRKALTILRLSPHNAVAIGDAENDHQLLQACEVGAAVEWGSATLNAAADEIVAGQGPSAVAEYLGTLAEHRRIHVPAATRHRLLIGHAADGSPLSLAVRGRNVLIAGDPKSGKSWVTGLMAEQLILKGYSLCVIDPEGDYLSLEALPGVVVLGGADPLPRPRDLLRALRHPDVSVVIDLSHATQSQKVEYIRSVLPGLATLRQRTGLPHRIVVDEAHYFLHDPDGVRLLDLDINGYTLVTYRASRLHPTLLAASHAVLVTRVSDPYEVRALYALCRVCQGRLSAAEWTQQLQGLVIGEVTMLPITDEADGEIRRLRLSPRLTPHVRHLAKYVDIPVPEARGFVLWKGDAPSGTRVYTLRDLVEAIEAGPVAAFDGHLRRHDFSRWIADVFGDYQLADEIERLEDAYRSGGIADVMSRLSGAIRSRYECIEPVPVGR
jgi:hydroxymethylpyrimidine pyrophosphatase-like HAD family hydrolase